MLRICSDSTCDLSDEVISRYGITIIPLHILLGDEEYRDRIEITQEEIFEWADRNKTTPKTSPEIPLRTKWFLAICKQLFRP